MRGSRSLLARTKDEIIFTSGATESNNLAIIGYATRNRKRGDHIVIAESEHISIHNIAKALEKQGFKVSKVGVNLYGQVSVEKLRKKITDATILVSIGWASSEIGTVQPMQEIGDALHGKGIALHTDAVAAEGLISIDVSKVPIDLLTLSSNDIYGPKGLGALYIKRNVNIVPIMPGGGQERGLRSGTENMPAIIGMAAAADLMVSEMPAEVVRLANYRDRLIEGVLSRIPKSSPQRPPDGEAPEQCALPFRSHRGRITAAVSEGQGHRGLNGLCMLVQNARTLAHAPFLRAAP